MSDGGKGSGRRPGAGYQDGWDRIFGSKKHSVTSGQDLSRYVPTGTRPGQNTGTKRDKPGQNGTTDTDETGQNGTHPIGCPGCPG